MLTIRKSADRGRADHGWLKSHHTFSFADYYDPAHMGFGPLRVINEDRVAAGKGFGTHAHRDIEIVTYVLDGALEHKDSMGNGSVLHYGDVQRMSAGTGVTHSEFNHSVSAPVHFLQIWIMPAQAGIAPGYEEKHFDAAAKKGRLLLVASPDGRNGSVQIHQDASIHAAILDGDDKIEHPLTAGRLAWLQVARGQLVVSGRKLSAGDALQASNESLLTLGQAEAAEIPLFDLPA